MEALAETPDLTMEQAISRAIEIMKENMADPLTMDDIARAAMYSKFHFSREFQRVTGVSPGRFLAAVRLQAAKQLLISTELTVTDIAHRVGYTSVGTFSTRFTSSVGMSPSAYRRLGGFVRTVPAAAAAARGTHALRAAVRGRVRTPAAEGNRIIVVGLFATRFPLGRPQRCALLHQPGAFVLDDVPAGIWHVLGYAAPPSYNGLLSTADAVAVGWGGPVEVRAGVPVPPVELRLRPVRDLDPPMLPALPDPRSAAFREGAQQIVAS